MENNDDIKEIDLKNTKEKTAQENFTIRLKIIMNLVQKI